MRQCTVHLGDKSVDIFNLTEMKLLRSIKTCDTQTSTRSVPKFLISKYLVLRCEGFLKFIDLHTQRAFIKEIPGIDITDTNLNVRALDENNLIVFNSKTNVYYKLQIN